MKEITIRAALKKMLLRNILFFLFLIAFQIITFITSLSNEGSNQSNPLGLAMLILTFGIWVSCYFEIRMIKGEAVRFLGYRCYVLFFYKLLCIPLTVLTSVFCFYFLQNVYLMILVQGVWPLIYFIYFVMVFSPYKNEIKKADEKVYISYNTRIKKWFRDKP